MSNIYERIDELCKKNNTNVTEMCRDLKIPRSSLSELKSGRAKSISADKIAKIADYFGVTALYITQGKDSDKENEKEYIDINDIRYAAYQELEGEDEAVIKDVINFIRFRKSQKDNNNDIKWNLYWMW